jgi:uncharacterized phage protein gp47/JayE
VSASAATTTWPTPAPGDITGRAAALFTQALPGIDVTNPNLVATTITRIVEMAMYDLYFYQANVAVELMPDTAVKNLYRFGQIYGVPQDQPSAAGGNVVVTGTPGQAVPSAITFSVGGSSTITYTSTAGGEIGGGGTLSVPVVCTTNGSAGNLAAGAALTVTTPQSGLTSQAATVAAGGITGGTDLESIASWRARILAQIRLEPAGGSAADYVAWAKAALSGVAQAVVVDQSAAGNAVSIVIAMTGLTVPTAGQVAEVQAYINNLRPVTALPTVFACNLNPINVTLTLNPDTPTIRAAAAAALALSFEQDATIGGTTYLSRLNNAVSSSDGEYSHELVAPAADVAAPNAFALNTLGTVTFA